MFRSICINQFSPNYKERSARNSFAIAKLKPGVAHEQARSQLKNLSKRLSKSYPDSNANLEFVLTPLKEFYVGNVRPYLLALFGVVGFVLLIACANVVNLLLTRAIGREKDLAIRSSLGAGRWDLMRQVFTESLVLALLGGGLGILMAVWGIKIINNMIQIDLPPWMTVNLDKHVLFFAIVISILAGLVSGIFPALHASGTNLNELLKEGTRGSSLGSGRHILRRILVSSEICLAMVLLVGAGLMIRTFLHLQNTSLGFQPDNLVTFRFALPWRTYETLDKTEPFVTKLMERLKEIPGVEGVEATSNLPLSGEAEEGRLTFTLEGQSADQQQRNPYINDLEITPGYFRLMGIPLLQGRYFQRTDHKNAPRVGIVSQRFAERMWPGQTPLGKRLKIGGPDSQAKWTTIIGVVGNVKHEDVTAEEGLDLYVSYLQVVTPNMFVLLKSRMQPLKLGEQATRVVWSIDRDQSTFEIRTMEQRISEILWQRRITGTLMILFSVLAVLLAAVGIYGVMSYSITQRTREIGIRMALGALKSDVRTMVLREVLALTMIGGLAGMAGSFALMQLMRSLFFKVSTADPLTYVLVPMLLILIALAAGFIPALRASKINPIEALHYE
jgi:putative ABC transport system permease protein